MNSFIVHSIPLEGFPFCPMKIDHKSGLTLYPGYWPVQEYQIWTNYNRKDLISVDLTFGLECMPNVSSVFKITLSVVSLPTLITDMKAAMAILAVNVQQPHEEACPLTIPH